MADRPKTPAARAAERIIETLEGRGGFDHWWGGIARVDQREILDQVTGIINAMPVPAAVPAAPFRPKLEIIRPDDESVEIYINGKEVASANHDTEGFGGMRTLINAAQAIARALGADVAETDDPMREPYTYFVAWTYGNRQVWGLANTIITRPTPIETDADIKAVESALSDTPVASGATVCVTNFIYIDGPS